MLSGNSYSIEIFQQQYLNITAGLFIMNIFHVGMIISILFYFRKKLLVEHRPVVRSQYTQGRGN